MSQRRESEILDSDGDAVVDAVTSAAPDAVRAVVEYDTESFNVLYVDEVTRSLYESDEQMQGHFAEIHSYVHLDFSEMALFTEDLFPRADAVEWLATSLDQFTLLRIYVGDQGLFVSLAADQSVEPVVDAVADVVEGAAGD